MLTFRLVRAAARPGDRLESLQIIAEDPDLEDAILQAGEICCQFGRRLAC